MSDKDSALNAGEGGNLPGSDPSQQTSGQPDSSSQQINPLDLLENQDFVEGLRRVFQSEKDRGVNRVQKEVTGIKDDLARVLDKLGVAPEKALEAQRAVEVEDAVAWYREQRQASSQPPQGSGGDLSGMIEGILLASGVDKSDTAVRSFLAQNPGADAPQKLLAYLKEHKNPPASSAGIAAPVGSAPATGEFANLSSDELGGKLLALQSNYRANKPEIDKITAELKRRDKK